MKRPRKQSRMQWFAMDVDAFQDDPRMRRLTTRERSFWSMMCIKSFRNEGHFTPDIDVIAGDTGSTPKEAEQLLLKLLNTGLLICIDKVDAVSNRMVNEYAIAHAACTGASIKGTAGAAKRYGNLSVIK